MEPVSLKWLAILGCAAAWTTFFSLFNNPGVRGWRNLGWLACYGIAVVMLFALPWLVAIATWTLFGIATGLLYFCYEVFGFLRTRTEGAAKPRVTTIFNGLFLWPVMLPEAIEYWLTDLGILKAAAQSPPPGQTNNE